MFVNWIGWNLYFYGEGVFHDHELFHFLLIVLNFVICSSTTVFKVKHNNKRYLVHV